MKTFSLISLQQCRPSDLVGKKYGALRSSEGHSKKTFRHRDTEHTEKFKKQSAVLCALCVSSEKRTGVRSVLLLSVVWAFLAACRTIWDEAKI